MSGENRVVEDEAAFLRSWGHEVEVFAPSPEGLSRRTLAAQTLTSRTAAREIEARIRLNEIEVVHVHNLFPVLGPRILRVAADAGAAVVMTLHNYRFSCLAGTHFRDGKICEVCLGKVPWRGAVHACYRGSRMQSAVVGASITSARAQGGYRAVHRFLAVSDFVRRKHLEAGLPAERVIVKPNCVSSSGRRVGPGAYYLVLSRLSPEKGVAELVRAWTPDLGALRIAGGGSESADLTQLAQGRNIHFVDSVGPEPARQLMQGARAALIPSAWYEGQPRVVLEAYAAGVPVIASRIGALPELIHEAKTGFTVRRGDLRGWQEAVRQLGDDELSLRLGAGAYEAWSEHFSPERGKVQLEDAYHEAVAARSSGTG